jgi:hypothetical protein
MAEGQYRIVKAELPLLGGIAGHNFLVLIDPNGKAIGELHGLATDTEGHAKPIGNLPSDRLKGHDDKRWYRPDFAQAEVASGDQAKVMNLWNAAAAARAKMDTRDIHYPWFGLGQNSNSFLSTMIAAMGLTEPPLSGGAPVKPGAGSMLLEPKDIQDIQRQFNIGMPRSGDVPNPDSQPDGVGQPHPLDSARSSLGPVGAPGNRTVAPPVGNSRSAASPQQNPPGITVPGAKDPTSLGGPNGPAPLVPPVRPRSQAPAVSAPAADPTLPLLHFAPDVTPSFGPFAVPGPFRDDAFGSPDGAAAASGMNAPSLVTPSFGARRGSSEANFPAAQRPGPIGDGNGIGDWWDSLAPAPLPDAGSDSVRKLSIIDPETGQPDPSSTTPAPRSAMRDGNAGGWLNSPSFPPARLPLEALFASDRNRALEQWASSSPRRDASRPVRDVATGRPGRSTAAIDSFSPDLAPAGGLLGMIQEYFRNNGY